MAELDRATEALIVAQEALEAASRAEGWGRDNYAALGALTARIEEQLKQTQQATLEAQEAAKASRTGLADLASLAGEVAWQKIQDQYLLWATYKDVRLLNLIYNRVLKHMQTLGIKDTSALPRAKPES